MSILPELFGIGGLLVGFLGSRYTFYKPKASPMEEPGVYPFTSLDNAECPKCQYKWNIVYRRKYCECEECSTGHFHIVCTGPRNGCENAGCKHEWIIRAADADQ